MKLVQELSLWPIKVFKIKRKYTSHHLPGQESVLHTRISLAGPVQAAPPFSASVIIVLVRDCCPLPHVLEQAVQSSKLFHWQSTATKYNNNNNKLHISSLRCVQI